MLPVTPKRHILTIALEDYFHGPAFRNLISRERWARFETRFDRNCQLALDLLAKTGSQATFFVRGWVAQSRADMVREIVARGHEIASAGNAHQSFRLLNREQLRNDLRASRDMIEDASGQRVLGYRVSDTSLDERHLWGLEVLAEEGFAYDSSLSPTLRAFHRQPWRRFIHEETFGDRRIWEVPLSSMRVGGLFVPIAGGNYFRQFPESFTRSAIARWHAATEHPFVTYFRLWDLDPLQPRINTNSFVRQIRHYRNADKMILIVEEMLDRYQFQSVASHLQLTPEPLPQKAIARQTEGGTREREVIDVRTSFPSGTRTPVSIVIPCFNEQASIPYLANTLSELRKSFENRYDLQFVFVDDGSSDATWETLREHFGSLEHCRLVRHAQNKGVSAAILTGIRESGEVVCSMDCDCTYDPHELEAMIPLVLAGADLVTASPYHPAGKVLNVPIWRLGISRVASGFYRVVTGRKLHTFTSCLRAYRRSAVLGTTLEHGGFLGVAELISKLAISGAVIAEHPATLEVRIFGQSKMKIARTSMGHLRLLAALARMRWEMHQVSSKLEKLQPRVTIGNGPALLGAVSMAAGSKPTQPLKP